VLAALSFPTAWAAAVDADAPLVYRERCAVCHGPGGRGDGPAAGLLSPRTRDFTDGRYKFRSTPAGTLPLLDDIERTIRLGLPGTSMPGYEGILPPPRIAELVRYLLSLAPGVAVHGSAIPHAEPSSIAAEPGRMLYERVGCPQCHGADGRGSEWRLPPAPPGSRAPGASTMPTNLSEPWTFRGGRSVDAITLRILTGIDGTPTPSYAESLSVSEAWAIAEHVLTLARRPIWDETDPAMVARAGMAVDRRERCRYLVNAMLCPLCHTPIGADDGAYDTGKFLAGGMRVTAYPWGVWCSRNLTADETGLGRWSEDDTVRALRRGFYTNRTLAGGMEGRWRVYGKAVSSNLTPHDTDGIGRTNDAELIRALRSGLGRDGRLLHWQAMP
jgi:mono/diheme cytochrome c family protein